MRMAERISVPAEALWDLVHGVERDGTLVSIDPGDWSRLVLAVQAARQRPQGLLCHDDGSIEWDGEPIAISQPSAARIVRALYTHGPQNKWGLMEIAEIDSENTLKYAISQARIAFHENRIPLEIRVVDGQYKLFLTR